MICMAAARTTYLLHPSIIPGLCKHGLQLAKLRLQQVKFLLTWALHLHRCTAAQALLYADLHYGVVQ